MTLAATERIMNIVKDIPDESENKVKEILITFIDSNEDKPKNGPKRTFGSLKDKIAYIAPDFDTCFDDDPAACGLEDYM